MVFMHSPDAVERDGQELTGMYGRPSLFVACLLGDNADEKRSSAPPLLVAQRYHRVYTDGSRSGREGCLALPQVRACADQLVSTSFDAKLKFVIHGTIQAGSAEDAISTISSLSSLPRAPLWLRFCRATILSHIMPASFWTAKNVSASDADLSGR